MTVCEGRLAYFRASKLWMVPGTRCQVIDDLSELENYGAETLAGKLCEIKHTEECHDRDMYNGTVARIRFDDDNEDDYMYWLPPTCLMPLPST